eukprot:6695446-Pyramimonas_sp.AAC.1
MAPHRHEVPTELHIFTDGSVKPRSPSKASWAMVVVGRPRAPTWPPVPTVSSSEYYGRPSFLPIKILLHPL